MFAGRALLQTAMIWAFYVAIEPFVRRKWPEVLISWTRLLSGRFRDPLVGRDVLIGCAGAVAVLCCDWLRHWALWQVGVPEGRWKMELNAVAEMRSFLSSLLIMQTNAILLVLGFLLLVFFLRILLRRDWAAIAVTALMVTLRQSLVVQYLWIVGPITLASSALLVFILVRFGLVAFFSGFLVYSSFNIPPMTFQSSAWYSGYDFAALFVIAGVTLYGFHTSLGGRRFLDMSALDR
jgi:hypothetical protein